MKKYSFRRHTPAMSMSIVRLAALNISNDCHNTNVHHTRMKTGTMNKVTFSVLFLLISFGCSQEEKTIVSSNEETIFNTNLSSSDSWDEFLDYAPRSQKILFERDPKASGNRSIWIMDADGKNQKGLGNFTSGCFSPDERSIFATIHSSNTFRPVRLDLNGNIQDTITTYNAEPIDISADGNTLLVQSYETTYAVKLTDGSSQKVIRDANEPLLFPDASKIMFFTVNDWSIFTIQMNGTNQQLIKAFDKFTTVLSYGYRISPDSKKIVLSGNSETILMNADGSGRKNIVSGYSSFFPSAFDTSGTRILLYTPERQSDGVYHAIITDQNGLVTSDFSSAYPISTCCFGPGNSIIYLTTSQIYRLDYP